MLAQHQNGSEAPGGSHGKACGGAARLTESEAEESAHTVTKKAMTLASVMLKRKEPPVAGRRLIPPLLQKLAGMGKHIIMVDASTGFMTSTMLAGDRLHPNQKGHDFVGDVWYAGISAYLY